VALGRRDAHARYTRLKELLRPGRSASQSA
jgi:hypothetical protein